MKINKKLWIPIISVDVLATLFLFVVSIIMLATMPDQQGRMDIQGYGPKNFIQWFQINPTAYLFIGVIPLFVLLGLNITGLVLYVKKLNVGKEVKLSDLSAEEKEALRKQLLNDLGSSEKK